MFDYDFTLSISGVWRTQRKLIFNDVIRSYNSYICCFFFFGKMMLYIRTLQAMYSSGATVGCLEYWDE